MMRCVFFFNDTATTEIYTLSLHDALPIFDRRDGSYRHFTRTAGGATIAPEQVFSAEEALAREGDAWSQAVEESELLAETGAVRSEEHTSELQSRQYLVCRLLLEKKKTTSI